MTRSRFKLIVSTFVVLSHVMVFFAVLFLHSRLMLKSGDVFTVLGAMIPLFGVFTTIIVKDTLRGQLAADVGPRLSSQMIAISSIILLAYAAAVAYTFKLFYDQVITTPEELGKWTSIIEAAFGVTLGLIIDSLFGGETSAQ